eukprot:7446466-Pyramimonas_sp.AAC.1
MSSVNRWPHWLQSQMPSAAGCGPAAVRITYGCCAHMLLESTSDFSSTAPPGVRRTHAGHGSARAASGR